jgi:hypothetical protein
MEQDRLKEELLDALKDKESQKQKYQEVINRYGYALGLINKEIDQLNAQLNPSAAGRQSRKWYYSNDWDETVASTIQNAGRPLTKDELEVFLLDNSEIPEGVSNKKQYVQQKILHALKRESIARYKISGKRKSFYCIPTWLDASGHIIQEIQQHIA